MQKSPDFRFNRTRKSGKTEFFEVHIKRAVITRLITVLFATFGVCRKVLPGFIQISRQTAHVAEKSAECDEQRCYQQCDKSSLYMYFKKLGFSGFSHPVEPEIRIFLHHNMSPCIRLNLRP